MKRFHHTDVDILDLSKEYQQTWYKKPIGLWYDINGSWKDWCKDNEYESGLNNKSFILDIDTSKILLIDSLEKIEQLHAEFYFVPEWAKKMNDPVEYIEWKRVAQIYDGVEMNPFLELGLGTKYHWQSNWDVESGCIWNLNVIKSVTKIQSKNYEKV